jgi:hypothetical protein
MIKYYKQLISLSNLFNHSKNRPDNNKYSCNRFNYSINKLKINYSNNKLFSKLMI